MALFKHKGFEISLTSGGHFAATVADHELTAETLALIRERIDKELADNAKQLTEISLPVVGIAQVENDSRLKPTPKQVFHAVIVGLNRTDRKLRFSGLEKGWEMTSDLLPDTPENVEKITRLLALQAEIEEIREAINTHELARNGWGRISVEDYPDKIEELKARYYNQEVK